MSGQEEAARAERLAAALRANLKRRKQQARGRLVPPEVPAEPSADAPTRSPRAVPSPAAPTSSPPATAEETPSPAGAPVRRDGET
ncbi:hypothetical protein KHC23_24180 [Ancylobacter dichloromethanicus]|uniref:Uncharacterized protein n=1 Tax=Ancylobacter dichloromethanicus TaxID=518825 RepID=A0A9W6JBY6_9HYPH|nr:hypothetical protein [Ancylobacter dichloromethanicus]MBS7556728.1 hypothetical protein [Ancylobacter dichloromethanicus]GLK73581.1 hypothetical protein GCM10017643_36980 [Ancylobacter dichloromethanicus]